jgi:hypothetical protein
LEFAFLLPLNEEAALENLVLSLYGLWFWLTRKYRAAVYSEVADTLDSARAYLVADYAARASTRDRGFLLPNQVEALRILDRHTALVTRTSRRFDSLAECRKFVEEELAEPPKAA